MPLPTNNIFEQDRIRYRAQCLELAVKLSEPGGRDTVLRADEFYNWLVATAGSASVPPAQTTSGDDIPF
jgi:hypothetical protein